MKEKIKPCPFCGNKRPKLQFQLDDIGDYRIQCSCGCTCGGLFYTKEQAIAYWNRRSNGN